MKFNKKTFKREMFKHDWWPLCSDINTPWYDTYHWWRCANCKVETEHTLDIQEEPSTKGCTAIEKGNLFPLLSL